MNVSVNSWILKIEIAGEWEQCVFETRKEALAAFIAIAADYEITLQRALLFPAEWEPDQLQSVLLNQPISRYVN